jgi:hypothetical protein
MYESMRVCMYVMHRCILEDVYMSTSAYRVSTQTFAIPLARASDYGKSTSMHRTHTDVFNLRHPKQRPYPPYASSRTRLSLCKPVFLTVHAPCICATLYAITKRCVTVHLCAYRDRDWAIPPVCLLSAGNEIADEVLQSEKKWSHRVAWLTSRWCHQGTSSIPVFDLPKKMNMSTFDRIEKGRYSIRGAEPPNRAACTVVRGSSSSTFIKTFPTRFHCIWPHMPGRSCG